MDVDLAELALRVTTCPPAERDAVAWGVCRDVLVALKDPERQGNYLPANFPGVADPWTADDDKFIAAMRKLGPNEDPRTYAGAMPNTFGRYRVAVWDHEASEARKLQTMLWVLRTLYRLRDAGEFDMATADKVAFGIGERLTMVWKCETVPLEGPSWPWATRATRRFDLLPKTWRYV